MKKVIVFLLLTVSIVSAGGFTLRSNIISGQLGFDQVFNGFGCSGKNISPDLSWINAPKSTKSFAITMYDPDAPTGSGWWHWLVFDIPKDIVSLKENAGNIDLSLMPRTIIQSKTDFGEAGFGGACPPKGDKAHKYIFTIYALDIEKLGLNKDSNPALVGYYLNSHTILKSSIISYFGR